MHGARNGRRRRGLVREVGGGFLFGVVAEWRRIAVQSAGWACCDRGCAFIHDCRLMCGGDDCFGLMMGGFCRWSKFIGIVFRRK